VGRLLARKARGLAKNLRQGEADGMETQTPSVTPLNSIPADVLEMLGPPPLLSTEDEKLYFAIVAQIARPLPSPDIITWMLIKDLADHRFEIARYRRLKTRLMQWAADQESARRRGLDPDADRTGQQDAEERRHATYIVASRGIYGNDPRFDALVEQELREERERNAAKPRGSIEAPTAQPLTDDDLVGVFDNWIGAHERIDALLRSAELRFTQALREIERHIFGFGRLLRDDVDTLIDGEFVSGPKTPIRAISRRAE
jgi:hypothetical protein